MRRGPLVGEPGAARLLTTPTGRPCRLAERRWMGHSHVTIKRHAATGGQWGGALFNPDDMHGGGTRGGRTR